MRCEGCDATGESGDPGWRYNTVDDCWTCPKCAAELDAEVKQPPAKGCETLLCDNCVSNGDPACGEAQALRGIPHTCALFKAKSCDNCKVGGVVKCSASSTCLVDGKHIHWQPLPTANACETASAKETTMTSPFPRVDHHMSDDDLTAAAERIHSAVDWRCLPKLAEIFMHRPRVNRYWHELVGIVLQYLEHGEQPTNLRKSASLPTPAAEEMRTIEGWVYPACLRDKDPLLIAVYPFRQSSGQLPVTLTVRALSAAEKVVSDESKV
jgi:hypothetical protein